MSFFPRCAAAAAAGMLAALGLTGCSSSGETALAQASPPPAQPAPQTPQAGQTVTLPSGLQITDSRIGSGKTAGPGYIAVVHYTGWLYENGAKGKQFDTSVGRGQPFEFTPGEGRVIKGWEQGVSGMKVGGKRTLIVPPDLGYGARGAGRSIPPNATLIFDIELIGVKG